MDTHEILLAVDTSSRVLSIAIRAGDGGIFEVNLEGVPRHAEHLIDLIDQGLRELGIRKHEIHRFIWGVGPGSFTGLRIGLAVLKGLHAGLGKRAGGVSSMDLIALGSGLVSGELAVCVDARREHIYTAMYGARDGKLEKTSVDSIATFEELMDRLDLQTVVTGDALLTYGGAIRERLGPQALLMGPAFWYPRAKFGIQLSDMKSGWLEPLSLKTMKPRYLRLSEPEEKSRILQANRSHR